MAGLNEYEEMLTGDGPAAGNEYDALASEKPAQKQTIQANLFANKNVEPARKAEVLKVASKSSLPTAFVDKNLEKIKEKQSLTLDYDQIIDESPAVARWMQDPDNVGLGKNDIDGLKKIDQSVQRFKPYKADPVTIHKEYANAVKGGLNQLGSSAYLLGAAYGKIDSKEAAQAVSEYHKKQSTLSDIVPTYVKKFQEILQKESGQIDKGVDEFLSGAQEYRKGNTLEALKRFAKGGGTTVGESLDLVYESVVNNPRAVGYMTLESLANSFPSLIAGVGVGAAGAAAGTAIPGVGNVAGGVAGMMGGTFAGSVGVEIGSTIMEEMSSRNVDLNDPDQIAAVLQDPALMSEIRARAERKGITTAAVDALFSVFAGRLAKGPAKSVAGKAGKIAGDVAVQAVGEAGSEYAGQVAKEKGDLTKVSLGDAIGEGIISLGHSVGETSIAMAKGGVKAAREKYSQDTAKATEQVVEDTAKSFKTLKDLESIQAASEEITKLKNVKEVPAKIKELIDFATGGDQGAAVYFQTDDWDNYWNKKGKSPAKMADEILGDNAKTYHESKETGASIEVPVGQFISKTALDADSKDLLDITRTSVDGPTLSEAQAQLDELPGMMEELAREATGQPEVDVTQAETEAKTIGQDITEQLKATGMKDSEAKTYSKIYEAAFNSIGQRLGVSPREIFDRYNLKINKPGESQAVEGETSFNQGITYDQENEYIEFKNDDVSASGEFLPADNIDDWLNPEGAGYENIPLESSGLDQFNRPFVVTDIKVSEGKRRSGKGSEAIRSLEKEAVKNGADVILLNASPNDTLNKKKDLAGLIKFYESLGFKTIRVSNENAEMYKPISKTLFQDETKGQIRFGKDGINIDLLKNADPSTFIHETGHFFLEVMGDLAETESAPQQIKDDWQTILDWFGVASRDQIKVEQHELWARGFEAYLMEGKAPSNKLRKAFHRFKIWLTSVYRQMRNLKVDLTPEVKNVMNRLLATEAEIQEAQTDYNLEPLFRDPTTFGLTGKKAERYLQAREDAQMAAEEQMLAKVMAGYTREKMKWWKDKRKTVLSTVTSEVDQMPVYKALALLQRGTKPDGSQLDEGVSPVKLDRQALIDQYGSDFVKDKLPRPFIYAREGGIHHDIVATSLGFESGDQMITQMLNMPPRKEFIDKLTDQRMHAEYPDLLASDDELEAAALQSIHNDKRAQLLRLELEYLLDNERTVAKDTIRRAIRRLPSDTYMKDQASKILGRTLISKVKPHLFIAAEKKAAKESAQALMAGDFDKAYTAKEKELLNHELYKAAIEAKEKIASDLDKFKKLFKKDEDLAKSRDLNLVNAGRAVLATFGIGKTDKSAAEYLDDMRRYDPDSYETMKALVDSAVEGADFYKNVSLNDFEEMSEAVLSLWNMSKRSKEILIEGVKLERQQVIDELSSQIDVISQAKERPGYTKAVTNWDKFKTGLAGFGSILRRVEQWSDAMDIGDKRGVFKKYVFNPVSEGATQYRVSKKDMIQKYLEIVKGVEKSITRDPIKAVEINYEFKGKQELLGALLHTGNESNKRKLLIGRGWGTLNGDGSLNSTKWDSFVKRLHDQGALNKADWDFVQNIWNLMESLKPQAQRAHFEMYGHYFNEITSKEFETPFGMYRGGYMPAIADTFMAPDAQIRADKELLEKSNNSFMFPTAGRGFTKSRVEQYAAPLVMDLSLVPRHIDKVLRFVHIEPRVKDAARLLIDRGFRQKLDGFDQTIGSEMLNPWLQRAAQQMVEIPSQGRGWQFVDQAFKKLRSNTGLNIMTANVVNTLQQVTGLSTALLQVKHKYVRNALWMYVRSPKKYAADISEKSAFMATRTTTSVLEVQNTIDEMLLNPSKYEKLRDFARQHGYFLQTSAQNVVDTIVWGGAYDQAVADGMTEKQAVAFADKAVRGSQGSFNPEDMSAFEVGSPMFRAFTMFYSYFNMLANLNVTQFQNTVREMGLKKGAGKLLYVYTFGFMVPAVLADAIAKAGGGDWDEDDDDSYMDDFIAMFFGSQFRMLTAFVPYVGQFGNTAVNMWNDKPYDDKISVSPAIGALESIARSPVSVYKAVDGEGSKKKAVKDVLTTLGVLTGVPVQPLARPIGYLIDVEEGNANPSGVLDFTRGLVTGRPGDN